MEREAGLRSKSNSHPLHDCLSSICFSYAMEPSNLVYTTLTSAKAAKLRLDERPPDIDKSETLKSKEWNDSPLNPKNRVDTLATPVHLIQWKMYGSSGNGSQFYAYPQFAIGRQPLHIDVNIPDQTQHPPALRLLLESGAAMTCPASHVANLGISRHVLHALAVWSSQVPEFETKYLSLPFRSRIMVQNIASDVQNMQIGIIPNQELDNELLSLKQLQELWQSLADQGVNLAVRSIQLSSLKLVEHKNEAISIVSIPLLHDPIEPFVFKVIQPGRFASNTTDTYHELKLLLSVTPHKNISARPLYIVTAPPKLGSCGFILPYYHGGSLLDALSLSSTIPFLDRVRWSRQITIALLHIHKCPVAKYHADLKPDNIMLTSGGDVKLVDFEQRGGWASWIAPEVAYIWYLTLIAKSTTIRSEVTEHYKSALQRLVDTSPESVSSHDVAWTRLSPRERESAMVFALGKTLWCIFEQQPTTYTDAGWGMTREAATWVDDEHSWRFPEFRRTPQQIQSLIKNCTAGADEWGDSRGRSVCFDSGRGIFVPAADAGSTVEGSQLKTQKAAQEWLKNRVDEAEAFLEARVCGRDYRGIQAAADSRPALCDILNELKSLR